MRHRITFITSPDTKLGNDTLKLDEKSLTVKQLQAAREDKLTFSFKELPKELRNVLEQCQEVHIRWDFGSASDPVREIPFPSRLPMGLHISIKPITDLSIIKLCPLLQRIVGDGIDCSQLNDSFTKTSTGSHQLYIPSYSARILVRYLAETACTNPVSACISKVSRLRSATYLDIDLDASSQQLHINAFWSGKVNKGKSGGTLKTKAPIWDEVFEQYDDNARLEIGILGRGDETEEEELSLGGLLADVGDSKDFEPTLFSFPSRHHPYPSSSYRHAFLDPTGLHPKLVLNIDTVDRAPKEDCGLYAYATVPQPFFVDPYQLADASLIKSFGLKNVTNINGETDLEAPIWTMTKWGATILAELDTSKSGDGESKMWNVTFPLHLRYLEPRGGELSDIASLPWPVVFWACRSDLWSKMYTNPFDRRLDYEQLFSEDTIYYHLSADLSKSESASSMLAVPVLDSNTSGVIEWGTVLVAAIGFLWILLKIVFTKVKVSQVTGEGQEKKSQ